MKTVCMIPARLGSKRIKKKNLRLLNGTPLISYVIRAAKAANCFDEIYVNSESDVLGDLAVSEGVKFYKRPAMLSTDTATNDDFTLDFLANVECESVIQLLPTSPFITPGEIADFVQYYKENTLDTLVSVKDVRIECVYEKTPINFNQKKVSPPSQDLQPIEAYACTLMGWRKDNYISNMEKYACGYHGGDGKIDFFTMKGFSTVDVDNEEDFQLAEVIARSLSRETSFAPRYYSEEHSEVDVPSILKKDGVANNDLHSCNQMVVNLNSIRKEFSSDSSWSKRVVNTENNSATLIHQLPGQGNRRHYHPDWNEWWYIVDGQWEWDIEGEKVLIEKDDIVFIPKGKVHKITATGNKPAIRLAVSREDVEHIYPGGDQ